MFLQSGVIPTTFRGLFCLQAEGNNSRNAIFLSFFTHEHTIFLHVKDLIHMNSVSSVDSSHNVSIVTCAFISVRGTFSKWYSVTT
jgi:hypothetical protein